MHTTITDKTTNRAEDWIYKNWVRHTNSLLKKHVCARLGLFLLTPASALTNAADTIIGLGVGVGAICTLGLHKKTNTFAFRHLHGSNMLVAHPYRCFLRTINPRAELIINIGEDGYLTSSVKAPLKECAEKCYRSKNLITRHAVSRLTYILLAVACPVARVADAIIGVPAAALSFLALGKCKFLNKVAYRSLQAPGIVNDLFYCTIKVINPGAKHALRGI